MNTSSFVGCILLLTACEAGGGSGSQPAGASPAAGGGCAPGPVACFCPDGTRSGTQVCTAETGLSACECPVTLGGAGPQVATNEPTRVCAELKGQTSCSATSYASQQVPSSILFVVDRSGSMACNEPRFQSVEDCNGNPRRADPNQPSRWEITVKALNDAFAGLNGSTASVGLTFFSTDGFCGVDSAPAVELGPVSAVQLSALSGAMAATGPSGGTPIVGGVILGYRHLHQDLHAAGNRSVVLITDGEESCGSKGDETDKADLATARDRLLRTEVLKARDANIKTFVIGAPGSEGARGFLSELAYLGQTGRTPSCLHGDDATGDCHFDLSQESDFAAVLQKTLGEIGGKALGCEFRTPPGVGSQVNVQYSTNGGEPQCVAQDTAAPCEGGANGWQFARDSAGNEDRSRVVLCGAACDTVKADPSTVVDVVLGCDAIIK